MNLTPEQEGMKMRCDMVGLLTNAANAMEELIKAVRYGADTGEIAAEHQAMEADSYVFALRQLATHVRETAAGQHTIDEFAETYCLKNNPD